MDDTSSAAALKMLEMLRQRTPAERLVLACSMHDFSKKLVISSILKGKPHLSQPELRKEIFIRFYGYEFDSIEQKKIIGCLNNEKRGG